MSVHERAWRFAADGESRVVRRKHEASAAAEAGAEVKPISWEVV